MSKQCGRCGTTSAPGYEPDAATGSLICIECCLREVILEDEVGMAGDDATTPATRRTVARTRTAAAAGGLNGGHENEELPPHMTCFACGKAASSRCAKCNVARYCSKECQRTHWKHHKSACRRDQRAVCQGRANPPPEKESDGFDVSDTCLHGAPPAAEVPHISSAVLKLAMQVAHSRNVADNEISALVHFCMSSPTVASDPRASAILTSAAVDAFGDTSSGHARQFMRCAVFLECFAAGVDFVDGVHSQDPDVARTNRQFAKYLRFLERTGARVGLLKELQKRIPCKCLTPRGRR